MPMAEKAKQRKASFNMAYFEFSELFDYYSDCFDVYVAENCPHFLEDDFNPLQDITRKIQTISALIFFMLLHIPLCRIHSTFTVLTGLLSLFLNMRTKIWFYEKANKIMAQIWLRIFKEDFEAVNVIKKSKEMRYRDSNSQGVSLD